MSKPKAKQIDHFNDPKVREEYETYLDEQAADRLARKRSETTLRGKFKVSQANQERQAKASQKVQDRLQLEETEKPAYSRQVERHGGSERISERIHDSQKISKAYDKTTMPLRDPKQAEATQGKEQTQEQEQQQNNKQKR